MSGAFCGSIPMGTETITRETQQRKSPKNEETSRVEMTECSTGTGLMGEEGLEKASQTLGKQASCQRRS